MAWNVWEEIPFVGYSYIFEEADASDGTEAAWIVRSGEKVLYLPPDFKPYQDLHRREYFAVSDTLLAFINDSQGVVIMKFPIQNSSQETVAGVLHRHSQIGYSSIDASDSDMTVDPSMMSDSNQEASEEGRLLPHCK
ncbi:hypothetical protein TrVFT333_005914 [Trichoderma virens FT-333]|nr:hypothetical protein TrVFT333_005914 [Trichoderma virens FT-333]